MLHQVSESWYLPIKSFFFQEPSGLKLGSNFYSFHFVKDISHLGHVWSDWVINGSLILKQVWSLISFLITFLFLLSFTWKVFRTWSLCFIAELNVCTQLILTSVSKGCNILKLYTMLYFHLILFRKTVMNRKRYSSRHTSPPSSSMWDSTPLCLGKSSVWRWVYFMSLKTGQEGKIWWHLWHWQCQFTSTC